MSAVPGGLLRPGIAGLRAYEAEAPGDLVKLDANESPYPPPRALREQLAAAAADLELNRYPDPEATALRSLLAGRWGWRREGILLGNGSDELIVLLLAACGGEGATLLVPTPTFSMYRHIALTLGWGVEEVPLGPGFVLDERALLARAAAVRPRLSVFASPNNPTGNLFDRGVLERYLRVASGVVVIDEAYHDFSGADAVPLLERHANLVVLRTLSKIGLAALRLGVLLAAPDLAREFNKVRLPYNVGAFPQAAARIVLEHPEFLAEQLRAIRAERTRLAAALAKIPGLTVHPSDANFILFSTRRPSRSVFESLRGRGVLVRDLGGQPGPLQGCLRVTVGTPDENTAFLEAIPRAALEESGGSA
ncbi:MAG TPA: histidinol-phosphate transaminase [Candidatus Methanoperedens sp.]|nr:histidinol-phosphate transaminase [Candidatus Methanoperedens sp.]